MHNFFGSFVLLVSRYAAELIILRFGIRRNILNEESEILVLLTFGVLPLIVFIVLTILHLWWL